MTIYEFIMTIYGNHGYHMPYMVISIILSSFNLIPAFAIGDTLLQDPSQDTVAFSGLDPNVWYMPSVTLFLAEEAEFNLGKMGDVGVANKIILIIIN